MKTVPNDVAPDATPRIGTGNASESVAAASRATIPSENGPRPSEKARANTAPPATETGNTIERAPRNKRRAEINRSPGLADMATAVNTPPDGPDPQDARQTTNGGESHLQGIVATRRASSTPAPLG